MKEYDPPEVSEPEDDGVNDTQKEKQRQTSKGNNDQRGGGSSDINRLNVTLVSLSEQVVLRAKSELLRETWI